MEELEITEGVSPEQESSGTPEPAEAPAAEAVAEPQAAAEADAGAPAETDAATDVDAAAETETAAEAEPEAAADADAEGEADAEGAQSPLLVMEVGAEELLDSSETEGGEAASQEDAQLRASIEALVYVAEEPITVAQMAASMEQPAERVEAALEQLIAEFEKPEHGLAIREVAGGYRMSTKPEHHEAVRAFVKSLKPPLKLSLPALETLAVIAYKQPVTAPEIKEIRGVQGTGVLNTLLERKLIAEAGRKNVIGKPILYKTTKDFLVQFGLKDLAELPTLKEFEEIRRMAFADSEPAEGEAAAPAEGATAESTAPAADAVSPAPAEVAATENAAAESAAVEAGPAEATPAVAATPEGETAAAETATVEEATCESTEAVEPQAEAVAEEDAAAEPASESEAPAASAKSSESTESTAPPEEA